MNIVDKAAEAQLRNLQERGGRTLEQLYAAVRASGCAKQGEMVALLKTNNGGQSPQTQGRCKEPS